MPLSENQTLSKLYYSIGEVAQILNVSTSLLRFWEKEFNLTVSKKNKKGNRLFSVKEIEQIKRIYHFVKVEGYTLEGAKKALKQKGSELLQTQLHSESSAQLSTVNNAKDFSDIILKLEAVKAQLLRLAIEKQQEQIAPVKKRNNEKSKPSSELPTLFDF
jgi:DNA-binding transcriptional MerR regulator